MTTNGTEERPLPDGWEETRVDEVANLLRGVSYKKAVASMEPKDGHLPILRATNIQDEKLVLEDKLVYVPQELVKGEQLLQKNDIVICMSSGSKHLVGKAARLTSEWNGSFGTFCAAIRFDTAIEPRFGGYFFGSQTYRNFIREKSSGVNINNLRRGDIESLEFPIPPFQEQERIADEIEKQFTRLDQAVASLRRLQSNLARYKASVLKAACEGRLVPQDPTDEPADQLLARILAERRAQWQAAHSGKKYKEPVGVEETAVLPDLPEGWKLVTMDMLTNHVTSGSRGWAKYYSDEGSLFVRVGNFNRLSNQVDLKDVVFVNAPSSAEADRTRLVLNDILVTITADVGMVGFVEEKVLQWDEAFINQHVGLMRLVDPRLAPYVSFIIASDPIQKQFRSKQYGLTKSGLNLTDLRTLTIPLPPLAEQERIVAEVERRLSVVSAVEQTITANLSRAKRLRQSILHRAFTGQLVPQEGVA